MVTTAKDYINQSWVQLFGSGDSVFTEQERKSRWVKWKLLSCAAGNRDVVEVWSDTSACIGCKHLDTVHCWCNLIALPCTVNPYSTFRDNTVGMACMGASYELPSTKPKQLTILDALQ